MFGFKLPSFADAMMMSFRLLFLGTAVFAYLNVEGDLILAACEEGLDVVEVCKLLLG